MSLDVRHGKFNDREPAVTIQGAIQNIATGTLNVLDNASSGLHFQLLSLKILRTMYLEIIICMRKALGVMISDHATGIILSSIERT